MMNYIYIYLLAVPIFFIIDLIWLGVIAQKFYQSQIGHLMGSVNWTAAIIFYLIYIVGILIFAVSPALDQNSLQKAIVYGALFGFFCYATYDFTNLATLRDWPFMLVVVDVVWGTLLTGSVAGITYYLAKLWIF